ncbi:MAG: hypothetical protein JO322_01145 [Candidatus Eremiobacteraeota bacterium]|nr:hypothetical protein [Candidatus Eremiobacteraeota bacterium]
MDRSAQTFLDGNAAAGELRDIFVLELSTATTQCASCGKIAAFAEARVYGMEPGLIARCSGCENPLMRVVKSSGRVWLDLRGLQFLEVPTSSV